MTVQSLHELTAAIRSHHKSLATELNRLVTELEESAAGDGATAATSAERLQAFLSSDLIPHAQGEERSLYPTLDPIISEHARPTATMSVDHEYIGGYAQKIGEITRQLRASGTAERARLLRELTRQAIQLQGLFDVHLNKEERVYLPLVEANLSAQEQRDLLLALHEEAAHASNQQESVPNDALDVRDLVPMRRHPVIFDRFNGLSEGDSFVLINDHDPKPLFYQLKAEYQGDLKWDYLEQGPDVWRVRIGK